MTEQEMLQEIERLRRELADVQKDRNQLHKTLCSILPVEETEITPKQFEELRKSARDPAEVLRDLFPADLRHLISEKNKRA